MPGEAPSGYNYEHFTRSEGVGRTEDFRNRLRAGDEAPDREWSSVQGERARDLDRGEQRLHGEAAVLRVADHCRDAVRWLIGLELHPRLDAEAGGLYRSLQDRALGLVLHGNVDPCLLDRRVR